MGWTRFACESRRCLPKNSIPRSVALAAGLGVFFSCPFLEIAGAAAATIGQLGNNPTPLFTDPLPVWLQILVLLGIAIGAVAANGLNIYSGSMAFLPLGIKLAVENRRCLSNPVVAGPRTGTGRL